MALLGCRTAEIIPTVEPVDTGVRSVFVGGTSIAPKNGTLTVFQAPFSTRYESEIAGVHTLVRSIEVRPELRVDADESSIDRMKLVRMEIETKDSTRHIKYSWDLSGIDPDWSVPLKKEKLPDGTWSISPERNLKRGEYVIWHPQSKEDPREGHTVWPGPERGRKYLQYMTGVLYPFGAGE